MFYESVRLSPAVCDAIESSTGKKAGERVFLTTLSLIQHKPIRTICVLNSQSDLLPRIGPLPHTDLWPKLIVLNSDIRKSPNVATLALTRWHLVEELPSPPKEQAIIVVSDGLIPTELLSKFQRSSKAGRWVRVDDLT